MLFQTLLQWCPTHLPNFTSDIAKTRKEEQHLPVWARHACPCRENKRSYQDFMSGPHQGRSANIADVIQHVQIMPCSTTN